MKIFGGFASFLSVGVLSTVIDWAVFTISTWMKIDYMYGIVVAMFCGAVFNFFANMRFTFEVKDKINKRIVRFGIIFGTSLLLTMLLMKFFVDGFKLTGVMIVLARVLVTGIIFIYNFFMHKYITFRKGD
jgi:putative flippase GtrA